MGNMRAIGFGLAATAAGGLLGHAAGDQLMPDAAHFAQARDAVTSCAVELPLQGTRTVHVLPPACGLYASQFAVDTDEDPKFQLPDYRGFQSDHLNEIDNMEANKRKFINIATMLGSFAGLGYSINRRHHRKKQRQEVASQFLVEQIF